MVAIGPAAALSGGAAAASCPNLLQRPRSRRSAGRESLIFRAFLRRRSRPGAPLQQIRTRLRPGPPQEPHPPHHAGAPRRRARMRCGGRSSGRRSGPVPAPPPRRLSRIMRWRLACRDAADPGFVCYAPSPSATLLFPVQQRVKGRSRRWVSAARAKKWGASLSEAAIPAGLSPAAPPDGPSGAGNGAPGGSFRPAPGIDLTKTAESCGSRRAHPVCSRERSSQSARTGPGSRAGPDGSVGRSRRRPDGAVDRTIGRGRRAGPGGAVG